MRAPRRTLLAGIATLALTPAAFGGVSEVRVHVDGMACPFCAYNIEKRLKTLEGVARDAEFVVSVERGVAELAWNERVAFDPNAVRDQIRRAGFTPAGISVTAPGTVRATDQDGRLELVSADQVISIIGGDRIDHKQTFASLQKKVADATAQAPFKGRVSGEVDGGGSAWSIVVHRWEPAEYGAGLILNVSDLACENCVHNVVKKVEAVSGVIHAEADFASDRVWAWTESPDPEVSAIRGAIEQAGFSVTHTHRLEAQETE